MPKKRKTRRTAPKAPASTLPAKHRIDVCRDELRAFADKAFADTPGTLLIGQTLPEEGIVDRYPPKVATCPSGHDWHMWPDAEMIAALDARTEPLDPYVLTRAVAEAVTGAGSEA